MGVEWRSQNSGDPVPQDAIKAGKESSGEQFFVARGQAENGKGRHPGKFGETTGRGVLFPFGGKEVYAGKYDILCGDEGSIKWLDQNGKLDFQGAQPVEGGEDENGEKSYVIQVDYENGIIPGKIPNSWDQATVGFGGKEWPFPQYRVLVHA